ncbi:MAG: DUF6504 family protein [Actinomycetota bacterium]
MSELIEVESYSGYKIAEKPRSFTWRGKRMEILRIERTWREEREGDYKTFFEIIAEDAQKYMISYNETADQWFLETSPIYSP